MERFHRKTDRQVQHVIVLIALSLGLTSYLFAQGDVTDLQTNLGDVEIGGQWIYGNFEQGIERALESGKPLFVLFR